MQADRHADPALTAALILSPIGLGDVDDLRLLWSDPFVALWTGPWTPLTVESWAGDMAKRWASDGVGKWMARDRYDASPSGGGFSVIERDGEKVLDLGWAIRDHRTRSGYATELGTAALSSAAQHLPDVPVVAFTEVHNLASRAVAEKLGMRAAGVIQRPGLIGAGAASSTPA
jgi:RimJ/RimL family protein N-acetyltransferase